MPIPVGLAQGLRDLLVVHLVGPFREWACVRRVRGLWKVDLALIASYLLKSPSFFIPRDRRRLGLPVDGTSLLYGDTPWDTAATLCDLVDLGPQDVVYDLGCGRGKFAFYARLARGCRVVGIDVLPTYIRVAERIRRWCGLDRLTFEQRDAREADLSNATVVLVAGATFSPTLHNALRALVDRMPSGGRWISVGQPYLHPRLVPRGGQEERFSWGFERVYLYHVADAGAPLPATFDEALHEAMGVLTPSQGEATAESSGQDAEGKQASA